MKTASIMVNPFKTVLASLLIWITMSTHQAKAFASSPVPVSTKGSLPDDPKVEEKEGRPDKIPLLPPVDPNNAENIPSIKLGEVLRLDSMGPIILNTDGTTRRISNWDKMTEKEQEVTWRRIKKRNEERRNKLLEEAAQQSEEL
jgi:hypothetical protein